MEAFRNEEIAGLLGDFYQAHANENREVMEQSLMKMQNLLTQAKPTAPRSKTTSTRYSADAHRITLRCP